MNKRNHLILYDGVCGACNKFCRFIIPRDPEHGFRFTSIQGELGSSLLKEYGKEPDDLNTIYVITAYGSEESALLSHSDAILFVLKKIIGPWQALTIFKLIPRPIRDTVYNFIARYRYKLMGKFSTCPIPKEEHKQYFLEN